MEHGWRCVLLVSLSQVLESLWRCHTRGTVHIYLYKVRSSWSGNASISGSQDEIQFSVPLGWPLLKPRAGGGRVVGNNCRQRYQRVKLWRLGVAHWCGLPRRKVGCSSQTEGKLTSVNEIVPDEGWEVLLLQRRQNSKQHSPQSFPAEWRNLQWEQSGLGTFAAADLPRK